MVRANYGVHVASSQHPQGSEVLTPEAIDFVAHLARRFQPRLEQLLARRVRVQARYDAGEKLDFLPETQQIRDDNWKVTSSLRCPYCYAFDHPTATQSNQHEHSQ